MKNPIMLFVIFLCGRFLSAEDAVFNWSLLSQGSWENFSTSGGTFYNRGEFRLNFLSPDLTLRVEVLDRRPSKLSVDSPWGDKEKAVTNFLGGLYHNSSGSRLLYGTLDEWGLSARIRNPWIRSPPYAENHKPLIADLKTAASSAKNDEIYLYLASPFLNVFPGAKLKGFINARTDVSASMLEDFKSAFASGFNLILPNKTSISLDAFYTGAVLPPTKNSAWFTYPPPLPERDFRLYSTAILFHNQFISVSGDLALSETFAWGTDMYGNFGVTFTPYLPRGRIARPPVCLTGGGRSWRAFYLQGRS